MWYDDAMQYVMQAVPLLLLAGIAALILTPLLRGRFVMKRPVRTPRQKKLTLHVTRSQMDDDLQDLIRRS